MSSVSLLHPVGATTRDEDSKENEGHRTIGVATIPVPRSGRRWQTGMDSAMPAVDHDPELTEQPCAGVQVDVDRCCDCRICEVVCSFHPTGVFNPSASAIQITYDAGTGLLEAECTDACDLCEKEAAGPLCIANCPIDHVVTKVWCG